MLGIQGFVKRSKRPKKFRISKIPQLVKDKILELRKANPTYGKAKIVILLKRDHNISVSESTVGRILSQLMQDDVIKRYGKPYKLKRKRKFIGHAARWQYGMKGQVPGQLVQIDHMTRMGYRSSTFKLGIL